MNVFTTVEALAEEFNRLCMQGMGNRPCLILFQEEERVVIDKAVMVGNCMFGAKDPDGNSVGEEPVVIITNTSANPAELLQTMPSTVLQTYSDEDGIKKE